jgi:hypothetical protein
VGGPYDGRYFSIARPSFYAEEIELPSFYVEAFEARQTFSQSRYDIMHVRTPEGTVGLWRHESLTPAQVLELLIARYTVPEKERMD